MNSYIPSGTSLFDVLSMIVPGVLIIGLVADIFGCKIDHCTVADYALFSYSILIILSYLVGLTWSFLMDFLFKWFRNNKCHIFIAKLSLKKSCTKSKPCANIESRVKNKLCVKKEYCYLCFLWISSLFLKLHRRKRIEIRLIKYFPNIVELYHYSYYRVAKEPIFKVITILEIQVAFIRNMLLVIGVYGFYILSSDKLIAGLFKGCSSLIVGVSLIILFVLLLFVMVSRQRKIYSLIWEADYYTKKSTQ